MPYFYFRCEIWRHRRVSWPRFPVRRENFGDSRTFKSESGIFTFAWFFRTFRPKMAVVLRQNRGRVLRCWLLTNSFLLFGVVTSMPLLAKIDQEMLPWERQTDRQTHAQTETNWIYNLSHAICYRYGGMTYLGSFAPLKSSGKITNWKNWYIRIRKSLSVDRHKWTSTF